MWVAEAIFVPRELAPSPQPVAVPVLPAGPRVMNLGCRHAHCCWGIFVPVILWLSFRYSRHPRLGELGQASGCCHAATPSAPLGRRPVRLPPDIIIQNLVTPNRCFDERAAMAPSASWTGHALICCQASLSMNLPAQTGSMWDAPGPSTGHAPGPSAGPSAGASAWASAASAGPSPGCASRRSTQYGAGHAADVPWAFACACRWRWAPDVDASAASAAAAATGRGGPVADALLSLLRFTCAKQPCFGGGGGSRSTSWECGTPNSKPLLQAPR